MMQIVFESTARAARQSVSERMNELMQSLFEFIEENMAGQEPAPAKKTAEPDLVSRFPTRTCSRSDEAAHLKELPVRGARAQHHHHHHQSQMV
eukprot:SAG31_NODE_4105_length_3577_cov_3.755894_1_plen_93_part_00